MKKPTTYDVAREAGVSQTAVSYVLSGSSYASRIPALTQQRILDAAERLGYSRSSAAAALQRGYSHTIVLLAVTWDVASFYSETTMLLSRMAAAWGLSISVQVAGDGEEADAMVRRALSLDPYGLLLLWDAADPRRKALQDVRSKSVPMVDLLPPGLDQIVSVTSDREQGCFLSAKHLLDLGHRRIGILLDTADYEWLATGYKLAGYKRAFEAASVDFDESMIEKTPRTGFESGQTGFLKLRERHPDVTALLCVDDPAAMGAIDMAYELGLRVPEDLSVVGFGAYRESTYIRPRLTTASIPSAGIAEKAIDTLIKMRTIPCYKPESAFLPMKLIVRGSTMQVSDQPE